MSTTEPTWWRRRPGVRGITRHFLANHIPWRVFEYATGVPPGSISLMFASDTAWRRVNTFPPDWAENDDNALIALSWTS